MPIFNLCAHVTVSAYTEVEADTLEEAIAEASQRGVDHASHGADPKQVWTVNDLDGEPCNIRAE